MKKRGGNALLAFGRRAVLEALAEDELEVERAMAARARAGSSPSTWPSRPLWSAIGRLG